MAQLLYSKLGMDSLCNIELELSLKNHGCMLKNISFVYNKGVCRT